MICTGCRDISRVWGDFRGPTDLSQEAPENARVGPLTFDTKNKYTY